MSWYGGSQMTLRDSRDTSKRLSICRQLASSAACVSITPLGTPLVPLVYCRQQSVLPSIGGAIQSPAISTGIMSLATVGT